MRVRGASGRRRTSGKYGPRSGALVCSFCGKSKQNVAHLIAGPGVYICDECVVLCNEIIAEERSEKPGSRPSDGG